MQYKSKTREEIEAEMEEEMNKLKGAVQELLNKKNAHLPVNLPFLAAAAAAAVVVVVGVGV